MQLCQNLQCWNVQQTSIIYLSLEALPQSASSLSLATAQKACCCCLLLAVAICLLLTDKLKVNFKLSTQAHYRVASTSNWSLCHNNHQRTLCVNILLLITAVKVTVVTNTKKHHFHETTSTLHKNQLEEQIINQGLDTRCTTKRNHPSSIPNYKKLLLCLTLLNGKPRNVNILGYSLDTDSFTVSAHSQAWIVTKHQINTKLSVFGSAYSLKSLIFLVPAWRTPTLYAAVFFHFSSTVTHGCMLYFSQFKSSCTNSSHSKQKITINQLSQHYVV